MYEVVINLKHEKSFPELKDALIKFLTRIKEEVYSPQGTTYQLIDTACWVVNEKEGGLPIDFEKAKLLAVKEGWVTEEWLKQRP